MFDINIDVTASIGSKQWLCCLDTVDMQPHTGLQFCCSRYSHDLKYIHKNFGERSGSVVECLTQDRGAAGLSLTSITALCP